MTTEADSMLFRCGWKAERRDHVLYLVFPEHGQSAVLIHAMHLPVRIVRDVRVLALDWMPKVGLVTSDSANGLCNSNVFGD